MSRLFTLVRFLIPLLIFSILIIFLWQGLHEDPQKIPSPLINKPIPNFNNATLKNPAAKMTSQQFSGHISLLNVWASWCGSCRIEHPVLMTIAHSHQVALYGLNYKDQRSTALNWLAKAGDPYRAIIYDPEGKLAINFGVYGTPETFLIDQNGIIRYKYIGPISAEAWQNGLLPRIKELALAEESKEGSK